VSEQHKFQTIKGMRDILPPDSALWNRVEQTARAVFESFGFGEIRLPILEPQELFARSVGADTDIVSKEMFTLDLQALEDVRRLLDDLISSTDRPVRFTGWLYELRQALKAAWETERIDRTESNRKAIERLDKIYGELFEKVADDNVVREAMEHPQKHPEIYDLIQDAMFNAVRMRVLPETAVLRPEATASVCRAYIEHGMHVLPGDAKLYYVGPMFRRERPQKGRYRQFYQIGAEVLGASDNARIDADVLEMLTMFLARLQLNGTKLYLNSIGHNAPNCRPAYVEKLRQALRAVKNQLGADSQRRIETNPLRVLDSKLPEEQRVIETLPRIADHLCADCRAHFAELQEQLKLRGIAYELNWRLVRGLDYYMRTTFEITATGLGSQDAICGGGRYDGLVELLGGPATKGIGFAIGTDRLILSLQEAKKDAAAAGLDVFLVWFGAAAYPAAVELARRLRSEGLRVELPADEMKFRKSLSLADRLSARHAVIIGEDELASGAFTIKKLADGTQQKLKEEELVAYLRGG